jgi:hypothetical protein
MATLSLTRETPIAEVRSKARDLRLDFFRGIALLMIFVDHVSGNQFAALTLQALGFADAAEVFVFIAGLAAVYAYRKTFLSQGYRPMAMRVLERIRTLYLTHVAMVAGVLLFALGAGVYGTDFDVIGKLGLQPLLDDPIGAIVRMPILGFMPNYLDILPLYVTLLAMAPLFLASMRVHALLPVVLASLSYAVAQTLGLTFPNFGDPLGWFLNPFAWVLLFASGMSVAQLSNDGFWQRLPRWLVAGITLAATGYVVFTFLHAAPWRVFPALESYAALSFALETNKAFLSWHRLVDLFAKAWLVAVLVPAGARFMADGLGGAISRAGRNSLPIFVTGTFLSLLGSVILYEGEGSAFWQVAVTAGGVIIMLVTAALIEADFRSRLFVIRVSWLAAIGRTALPK